MTADKAGIIRGQKDGGAGNVIRSRDPANGMAVNAVLKEFALQRRIDVDKQGCIYNTGADRVYIDAERRQLDTQLVILTTPPLAAQ